MDVDSTLEGLDLVGDIKELAQLLPVLTKDGLFNGIYYDPPWAYSEINDRRFKSVKGELQYGVEKRVFALGDLEAHLDVINKHTPSLLHERGKLIVKIMDTRLIGEYLLNHVKVIERVKALKLLDVLIFVLYNRRLRYPNYSQTSHGFYLVFQKKVQG